MKTATIVTFRKLGCIGAVLLVMATGSSVIASTLSGDLILGSGYLDNPIGLDSETAAGYISETLRLASTFDRGAAAPVFKLGYEGSAAQFTNDVELGSIRHGLGVEWFRAAGGGASRMSAGLQASLRTYDVRFAVYDHRQLYGYLAFKRSLRPDFVVRGFAAARWRVYGDLPEESYIEPFGQLALQRFFASRTTLGLSLRYGGKIYNDSVAPSVWETTDLPSTSQLAARLNLAKGFSDRLAWRGWVESRWRLSEFPHFVADEVYDSPLLDVYAHEGTDLFTAVKVLGPWQTWLEAGASLGDHDYGGLLFATAANDHARRDTVREAYLAAERTFSRGAVRPRLRLAAGWRDQDSSLPEYTYAGIFASSSLSLQF